jgi:predicted Holliday junction resolvase-like endonuclease
MENGFIMLLVIALFFLSMYLYAYGTTNYAIWKEEKMRKRKLIESQKKEEQLKAEMAERQKQREEKYRIAHERSLEIQEELKRLEKFNKKISSKVKP